MRESNAGLGVNRRRLALVVFALATALPTTAWAQAKWPDKPVRIVVPWAPGGQVDFLARHIAQIMSKDLGQPVIVENKPGAGSNIGSNLVAKAPPDGYTLLLASSSNAINQTLIRATPYNVLRDFVPIALLAEATTTVVVNPSFSAKSLPELIAMAKKQPDNFAYATPGIGSPAHLAAELFSRMAGIRLRHTPYQGGQPAVTDVMAGHLPIAFVNLDVSQGFVAAGRLRMLAVTQPKRWPLLPDVPTVGEVLPGYQWTSWLGLMAPAGTPPEILTRLRQALGAVREPASMETLRAHGAEPLMSTQEQFRDRLQADVKGYAQLIRDAGITAE